MKRSELKLHPGGLYRCCLKTVNDWLNEAPDAEVAEGEKFACRFEPKSMPAAQMIVTAGVVRWFDPDYPPVPPRGGHAS